MNLFKKLFGITLSGGDKLTLPAADGSDGQIPETDGAGNLDWFTQTGDTPIFGTECYYVEDDTIDTSTLATFTEKLKLTTGPVVAGDYYIGWNYQWSYNQATRDFIGQVELDDTTVLMTHQQEPADAGADQDYQLSGFKIITLSAGVHDVDIDWSAGQAADTATIHNARLILYRVS